MRFAECIKLLAADAPTQLRVLGQVPENAHVRGYEKTNSVFRMAWLYCVSFGVYDGVGGSESLENWIDRTELTGFTFDDLSNPFWRSARRVLTALQMIERLDQPFLYSSHGLRNADEWALVRHLATETCHLGEISITLDIASFDELSRGMGNGIIEMAWPARGSSS